VQDRWDVYDPTGNWQGTVEFPPEAVGCTPASGLTVLGGSTCNAVLEIGDDYVLILHLDAVTVSRVRMHRLVKP
jgi:hypothetical protein